MTQPLDTTEVHVLIEQLYEPETRRRARRRLVRARAVEPLLECLNSTNESVVWSAIESLGELRAKEAVDPLVDLLARGRLVLDVCESLTQITGQDFGADVQAWKQWASSPEAGRSVGLDVADCVRRTAAYLGVEPSGSDTAFRFRLSLDEGRSQKVNVYFGREHPEGGELVVIYSECGPASSSLHEKALRKNMSLAAGAFAIRDVDGQPQFVLVDTMLAAAVTPSVLAKKIESIASQADSVEKTLAKEDTR